MKDKLLNVINNSLILLIITSLFFATCTKGRSLKENTTEKKTESPAAKAEPIKFVYKYKTFARARLFSDSLAIWKNHAPFVKIINIKSSLDSKTQSYLYYDSGSKKKKPLLVVLHSWSSNYEQTGDIPYALFAKQNDWVFIHPNFRGINKRPQSTCSELAVQDVLDAVKHVKTLSNIDTSRVYLTGFSGGAMMSLVLSGRHPELWTAAAVWVPVFDLESFYWFTRRSSKRKKYSWQIYNACGGMPVKGRKSYAEYIKRSPYTYLKNAKGKKIKIFLAAGIADTYVPPSHALNAYNVLADDKDKIPDEYIQYIDRYRKLPKLPENFNDKTKTKSPLYEHAKVKLIFSKTSSTASVFLFDCGHNMIYNVGLDWLSREKKVDNDE